MKKKKEAPNVGYETKNTDECAIPIVTETNSMPECAKPIDEIFNERETFIVVGFTGGTGAGCTSAAKILGTDLFEELKLHKPKSRDFLNSEERKYEIIYDYAKYHWNPFKSISMSDMIISFIIQGGYDAMLELIQNVLNFDDIDFSDAKIDDIGFEDYFRALSKEFNDCLENNTGYNTLKRSDKNRDISDEEIQCLEEISKVREKLKETLSKRFFNSNNHENPKANAYTYFLQTVGDNLRVSGKPLGGEFTGKHMAILARRANGFIKAFRRKNRKTSQKTLLCIDAIRNPYEATYFQDRYNAFYLVAINTDNDERRRRLSKEFGLNDKQFSNLDKKEYPKLKGNDVFTKIDIGACCELGDIHINNPKEVSDNKYFLTEQLVKYVTLMKHPGLITPSAIERCMQIAYNAKLNSGCLSRQVGAVITDASFSIKAVGWNSTPQHQVPCNLRHLVRYFNNLDENEYSSFEINDEGFGKMLKSKYDDLVNFAKAQNESETISSYDVVKVLGGRHYTYCFKDVYQKSNPVHTRSLHAEENAFLQLAKNGGEGINGGNLFTTASSCVLCSKKAYHLGIKNIYYIIPYPDIAQSHIIEFGKPDNEHNPKNILFSGAIGRAYTSLYTQRIAFKDELGYLVPDSNNNNDIIKRLNKITEFFKDGKVAKGWEEIQKLESERPSKTE